MWCKTDGSMVRPFELFTHLAWSREREILVAYYFKGWTSEGIGGKLGLSRERVRQLRERGLERLRVDHEIKLMLEKLHRRAYNIRFYGGG